MWVDLCFGTALPWTSIPLMINPYCKHPQHSGDRSQASGAVRIRDDEPRAAGSGGGAALPTGGAAASTAPQLAPASRRSQATCDEQHRDAGAPGHCCGKSPVCHSQDEPDRRARSDAGAGGVRPREHNRAPSNPVRSRSASRSTQISPPPTPAEALARVQLLLDFPPPVEKLDEWRATIRSLVAVAQQR